MRYQYLLIAAILALTPIAAPAQSHSPAPEGWLWYREQPVQKPAEPQAPKPAATAAAPSGPAMWSTAWIRDTLPRLMDQAVEKPTPENVRAYLALQKVSVNRAQAYAQMAMMVTQGNAGLDENARFPSASAAAQEAVSRAQGGLIGGIQTLAKSAGLFFFFRSDCPYCHRDLSVLRTLELVTGMHVTAVSLDGQGIDDQLFPNFLIDNGQGARLGVRATPAFFLVRPPNLDDVVEIGQGYLSLDELETRIVEQAYYRHWLGAEDFQRSRIAAPLQAQSGNASAPPGLDGDDIAVIQAAVATLPPDHRTAEERAASTSAGQPSAQ
ncbi:MULTISPECIES: conjugal transfer protein TraF [Pseudomonadota]|uniref:Conjugal transfer protein TraF n=1 Tax=Rhodanobacter denitrificans TaxID=666685 RepID=M4NG94_9GAMM|nr:MULTISPECIES: conjugal transfer protein TraF [Pseudomonadota]AGG89102.1 hypothetical protein R2APBS1_1979 [Rhodanobacter denitrificans]TAN25133.1 MAG: conjugal transfer protein TraF [Castellaniella sp.]UJJ52927.1 conjugal transfer protein TraF [Rhodanobacter denitrificans]